MQTERIYSFLLTAAMLTAVICSEPAFADGCSSPTFVQAPAIRLAWIGSVYAMAVGDFDGDGKVDLAVDGGVVSLLLGIGDGTFRPPARVFDQGLSTLAAADFNSDGHLDLVVGGTWGYSAPDWLLLGNGDGTFIGRQIDAPADLVADFNLDGKPDLAGGLNKNVNGQSDVYVSFGKGDGSLSSAGRYKATLGRNLIAGGDLNNDGTPDLWDPLESTCRHASLSIL